MLNSSAYWNRRVRWSYIAQQKCQNSKITHTQKYIILHFCSNVKLQSLWSFYSYFFRLENKVKLVSNASFKPPGSCAVISWKFITRWSWNTNIQHKKRKCSIIKYHVEEREETDFKARIFFIVSAWEGESQSSFRMGSLPSDASGAQQHRVMERCP